MAQTDSFPVVGALEVLRVRGDFQTVHIGSVFPITPQ